MRNAPDTLRVAAARRLIGESDWPIRCPTCRRWSGSEFRFTPIGTATAGN